MDEPVTLNRDMRVRALRDKCNEIAALLASKSARERELAIQELVTLVVDAEIRCMERIQQLQNSVVELMRGVNGPVQ